MMVLLVKGNIAAKAPSPLVREGLGVRALAFDNENKTALRIFKPELGIPQLPSFCLYFPLRNFNLSPSKSLPFNIRFQYSQGKTCLFSSHMLYRSLLGSKGKLEASLLS